MNISREKKLFSKLMGNDNDQSKTNTIVNTSNMNTNERIFTAHVNRSIVCSTCILTTSIHWKCQSQKLIHQKWSIVFLVRRSIKLFRVQRSTNEIDSFVFISNEQRVIDCISLHFTQFNQNKNETLSFWLEKNEFQTCRRDRKSNEKRERKHVTFQFCMCQTVSSSNESKTSQVSFSRHIRFIRWI